MGQQESQHEHAQPRCPICDKLLDPDAATFPFCSDRCRLVDLGKWFREDYRVTRPARADDELTE